MSSARDRLWTPPQQWSGPAERWRHRGAIFDLWTANRRQLARRGVREVEILGVCTRHAVDRYFSHRGEQGRAGRGMAFLGWKA